MPAEADIYTIGNTLRFRVEFRTWEGSYEDPVDLQYCLIDQYKNVRVMEQGITEEHREGIGRYKIDITVPNGKGPIVLQISGTLEGTPITARKLIQRSWVSQREWDDYCPGDVVSIAGNTIRLLCTYAGWDGSVVEPELPSMIIYDGNGHVLRDRLSLTNKYRITRGIYEYFYRVPNGTSPIVVEFTGIVDDTPVLARREIPRVWVEDLELCKVK